MSYSGVAERELFRAMVRIESPTAISVSTCRGLQRCMIDGTNNRRDTSYNYMQRSRQRKWLKSRHKCSERPGWQPQ